MYHSSFPTEKQECGWHSVWYLSLPDRDEVMKVLHCPFYRQRWQESATLWNIYPFYQQQTATLCNSTNIYICLPTENLQSRWCSAWYLLLPKTDNREKGRRVLHCIMYAPYQQRCRKVGGMLYYISLYPAECYSVWCIPHTNITNREAGKWVVQCITSLSTQQNATLCNVPPLPTEAGKWVVQCITSLSLPNRVLHCVMYPPSYQQRSRKVGGTMYCISLSTQQRGRRAVGGGPEARRTQWLGPWRCLGPVYRSASQCHRHLFTGKSAFHLVVVV